jgi:hypothetical protein
MRGIMGGAASASASPYRDFLIGEADSIRESDRANDIAGLAPLAIDIPPVPRSPAVDPPHLRVQPHLLRDPHPATRRPQRQHPSSRLCPAAWRLSS